MKNQVQLIILLFFALTFLIYAFPFIFVEAAKLESGVTIKEAAPPTNETAPPTNEICNNGIDDDGNGATDEDCAAAPAGPTAGKCGLQIVYGVPINYGQLNPGQESDREYVVVKNVGHITAAVMVKGGDWISDAAGSPTVSGPEITYVSIDADPALPINPNNPGRWAALKSNDFHLGMLRGQETASLLYALLVPPSGFSGSLHQELSIDLFC